MSGKRRKADGTSLLPSGSFLGNDMQDRLLVSVTESIQSGSKRKCPRSLYNSILE